LISDANVAGEPVRPPLPHSQLIDLTTTGRHTGRPRRVEIVLHNFDGRLYISGTPNPARKRAWLLNLESDPRLTIHLKGSVAADLPGTARIIDDEAERRRIFARLVQVWRGQEVDTMTKYSPLIEVSLNDRA
jgi:deazaflavin-dependent oxidoreductase (nitroreductase family)